MSKTDDDVMIADDPSWLETIGAKRSIFFDGCWFWPQMDLNWTRANGLWFNSCRPLDIKTRGDLRRLIAALKFEPEEQPNQ